MSHQNKPVAYNLYPIRDDSDEEDIAPPGSLFRRYKLGKGSFSKDNCSSSSRSSTDNTAQTGSTTTSSNSSGITSIITTSCHGDEQQQQASASSAVILPTHDNWCHCGNCGNMGLLIEKKCCFDEVFDFTNFQDDTFRPGIDCVLKSTVLVNHVLGETAQQLLWLTQQQYLGNRGNALLSQHMTNLNYRHFAYKSYIKFMYGYLGAKNRKVIPACVVAYIRKTWPSPDGTYVGYKDGDNSDDDEGPAYIPPDELAAIMDGTEI